jgi:biopolymer transport protein ExbD
MAIIGPTGNGEEDEVVSAINTTPLVDVMLVLLIIFMITIPVVTHTVPVTLPKERSIPLQTKPENVLIAVDRDGGVFWNAEPVSIEGLVTRLQTRAAENPLLEVQIRGDANVRYEAVGQVVAACKRAGIVTVGFITEPPARGA